MFERWMLSRILMAKAGEGGAGGGAGGDDGDDDEAKFTERFNKLFHAAMKGERKKIAKDTADEIAPALADMIGKGIGEAFTKAEADRAAKAGDEGGKGKEGAGGGAGGAGALSPDVERRIKAAEEKAEKAERLQKEADDKRRAAEIKQLRDEERTQLVSGLTERGVRKALVGMAAKDLHERIVRDPKTNEIVFKLGDDEYDLGQGLDKYMESDAGKELLPPRDVGGSGNHGANAGGRKGGKQEMGYGEFAGSLMGGKGG